MLNTKKMILKMLDYFTPKETFSRAFKITNTSINWGGNNYVSVPSSAVPSGLVLVCAYNGGFQGNPRWITSYSYQNGTWVLHSDTAISGNMTVTLIWIKSDYF